MKVISGSNEWEQGGEEAALSDRRAASTCAQDAGLGSDSVTHRSNKQLHTHLEVQPQNETVISAV